MLSYLDTPFTSRLKSFTDRWGIFRLKKTKFPLVFKPNESCCVLAQQKSHL